MTLDEFNHGHYNSDNTLPLLDEEPIILSETIVLEVMVNCLAHLLKIDNRYRLITPKEAERLQNFLDVWTKYKQLEAGEVAEVSERMRIFL